MSGQTSPQITIKRIRLNLNFETQISPTGRPFRLSGTAKNLQLPSKYIDRVERWHWIHTFRYLDEKGGLVSFEFDYNDIFYQMLK